MKTNKEKTKGSFLYTLGMLSYNMEYMIIANLSFALTDSYAISAITVGLIFMVSRFFDGVTDIIAGIVIDRFNPTIGKARVYDLLHIPMWIILVLVFSVPNVGNTGKIIWVFVFYNLLQSVITTFMNVAEPLRLQRSFIEEARVKVMTVTSALTMLTGVVGGIAMPVLIGIFAEQPHGWTIITSIFAVPFAIFGLLRFLLLPEMPNYIEESRKEKIPSIKESLMALVQNKYALLYGILMICWAMTNTTNTSSSTYYFKYVYGDVSAAGIVALPVIFSMFFALFIPKLMKKLGKVNTVRCGLIVAIVCSLIKYLFPYQIIVLAILSLGVTCGTMILSFMKPILTIDCITYGKWKTGNAVEAVYSSVNSLADKIGLGLGSALLGAVLQIGGYRGELAVQNASAIVAIRILYALVPAALLGIALVAFIFFDLDKKLEKNQHDS